ncbi:MAG: hypothetical protein H0W05_05365 [Thermoleophilaceae bacterium]|jgi:hypothetical protein|nr:hypothetical protein [Thermoleophilaceae bacterium]
MLTRRLARVVATCVVAAVSPLGLAACGAEEDLAHREGLALPLEGITYNVFITRQLNLEDVEDRGYTENVQQAPPGSTYYGVFLEACNVSEEPVRTAGTFRIVDTAGNEFEPLSLDSENPFSYTPTELEPGDCIPAEGSLASSGPTAGALLIFELPLENTENRPLELEVLDGYDVAEGHPKELIFELDI